MREQEIERSILYKEKHDSCIREVHLYLTNHETDNAGEKGGVIGETTVRERERELLGKEVLRALP